MNEFTLFFSGILAYLILFFGSQILLFRTVRVRQLILTFSALAFGSGFITWTAFYFLSQNQFPEPMLRFTLAFGGLFGCLGFSGTYIILGPISADRSLSAHMCIQVLRAKGRMLEADLRHRYNQDVIFQKRFDEYVDVGVMKIESDTLVLTGKGKRIAYTFLMFLKLLKMKENF